MKNKFKLLLLPFVLSGLVTLSSCGDAGVQVRVGDEFDTGFEVLNFALSGLVTDFRSTTIRQELLEYGDFITELDITSIRLGFDQVDIPFDADLILTIANQSRSVEQSISRSNIQVTNATEIFLTSADNEIDLLALANILRTEGELVVEYEVSTTDFSRPDFFDIDLTFEVFATIKAD